MDEEEISLILEKLTPKITSLIKDEIIKKPSVSELDEYAIEHLLFAAISKAIIAGVDEAGIIDRVRKIIKKNRHQVSLSRL